MRTIEILPYEILNAFQDFLSNSSEFETFLNTYGFTNHVNTFKRVTYIHYPNNLEAIKEFPFISFEAYDAEDKRTIENGFMWTVNILLGIEDKKETVEDIANFDVLDFEKETNQNVIKYTKSSKAQELVKKIIEIISDEMEISGIKGNFEIEFDTISTSTTATGEQDSMYGGIELNLISYKEI
jgi:hypothetical protein